MTMNDFWKTRICESSWSWLNDRPTLTNKSLLYNHFKLSFVGGIKGELQKLKLLQQMLWQLLQIQNSIISPTSSPIFIIFLAFLSQVFLQTILQSSYNYTNRHAAKNFIKILAHSTVEISMLIRNQLWQSSAILMSASPIKSMTTSLEQFADWDTCLESTVLSKAMPTAVKNTYRIQASWQVKRIKKTIQKHSHLMVSEIFMYVSTYNYYVLPY